MKAAKLAGCRAVGHIHALDFGGHRATMQVTLETLDGPVPATYPGGVVTLMPGQPLRLRGDAPPPQ